MRAPYFAFGKAYAGIDDRCDVVASLVFVFVGSEKVEEEPPSLVGTEFYEKLPDFVVEEYHQNDDPHADEFVHDGAHELHVENAGDDHPYTDEDEYAREDVYRARLLHEAIEAV